MPEILESILEPLVGTVIISALIFGILAIASPDSAKRLRDWAVGMPMRQRVTWLIGGYLVFGYLLNQ